MYIYLYIVFSSIALPATHSLIPQTLPPHSKEMIGSVLSSVPSSPYVELARLCRGLISNEPLGTPDKPV